MIEVYYTKSLHNLVRSTPTEVDPADYDKVAEIGPDDTQDGASIDCLGAVFRAMNAVDGSELCCKLHVRSMSVGDIAVIDGVAHYCCSTGWAQVQFS